MEEYQIKVEKWNVNDELKHAGYLHEKGIDLTKMEYKRWLFLWRSI